MNEIIKLFDDYEYISDKYTVIGEWEIWVQHAKLGKTRIAVRIKQDQNDLYYHDTNYFYQPGGESAPYVLEQTGQHAPEAAVRHAMNQLFTHYRPDDAKAEWILNENF